MKTPMKSLFVIWPYVIVGALLASHNANLILWMIFGVIISLTSPFLVKWAAK